MTPDIAIARAARLSCRNAPPRPTAGLAPGFTQCNLIALPRDWAWDFLLFWACGVTPQAALMASRPPFAITHAPGHMFITDVPDTHWQV
ncbi:Protein of unknown function [Paracoccus aminovorans]|uniref:Uncharacterized protein n=1 Tax=Paracoccus aminovorans TaxID=34004 RepID=A0A1I2Z559_9RHOB|nr:DUF1445 domain-containing protein [Paracoccus aminovorans]CQR83991.1 hypothetical protein JCM7685_pAMV3p0046 [Paracoccus aminovorans]SFH32983.1 Protein of unknown function [Paracoccus aminovorans]